ncbi:MAG: hypothetical protein E7347_06765 [Clostridiales bacterium]|nr:hypothetical protein [Clostridiales bacterium]
MANKYFYYVLVHSENNARFITKVDNKTKYAYWNKDEPPMLFAKSYAEDLAYCLNLNFHPAFVVESYFKITKQIFNKENENETKNND